MFDIQIYNFTSFVRHANIPQENGCRIFTDRGRIDFKISTESTDREQSVEYNKSTLGLQIKVL